MPKVTIIRHAQSDYPNDALSNEGREQASFGGERFSGFSTVVCSTKNRSQETANLLGYSNPIIDPRLDEFEADIKAPTQEEYVLAVHTLYAKELETMGEKLLEAIREYGVEEESLIVSHNAVMSSSFLLLTGEVSPFDNLVGFQVDVTKKGISKPKRI